MARAKATENLEWSLVSTEEDFMNAMELTDRQALIVVDLETTKATKYGGQKIIGVSWGFPQGSKFRAFYAPFRHGEFEVDPENLPEHYLAEFTRWKGKDQVYHGAGTADLIWWLDEGIDFSGPETFIWDTMIMSHMCDEHEFSYALDDLSNKYYRERKKSLKEVEEKVGWSNIHPLLMGEYACLDVFLTFKHFLRTRSHIEHEEMISNYRDSERYLKTLMRIIMRGIPIDLPLCDELQEEGRRQLVALRDELRIDPAKSAQVIAHLHGKLGVPVVYKTKGGKPATDSTSLLKYAESHPQSRDFVEKVTQYRTISKQVSTWFQGFKDKADDQGFLHPGIRQYGTVTTRLSQREPNLQQIPRNIKGVRRLFMDTDDLVLVEFDYAQVELRLASYYLKKTGDETFYNAYREGQDVHVLTSERLGLHRTMGPKEGRQIAKQINFLLLYGGGPKRFRDTIYKESKGTVNFSMQQCYQWHKQYHESYPGVNFLYQDTAKKFNDRGYIKFFNGRRRHLGFGTKPKDAWNSLIQGGCGQILMLSLNYIDQKMPDLKIVNTVHDSIWVRVPRDELPELAPVVCKMMGQIPTERFELPFEVEWKEWSSTT